MKIFAFLMTIFVSAGAYADENCTVVNYIGTEGYTVIEQDDSVGSLEVSAILLSNKPLDEVEAYLATGEAKEKCPLMAPSNPSHRYACTISYIEETDKFMVSQGAMRKSPELSKQGAIQARKRLKSLGVCL